MKLLLIFGFLLLFFTGKSQIRYTSAAPYSVEVIQPDGSKIEIVGVGDEFKHYSLTKDGYTALKNKDGFFEYAKENKRGELELSGFRVRKEKDRTNLEKQFLSNTSKFLKGSKSIRLKKVSTSETELQKAFPSSGARKILLLLIKYPDLDSTYSQGNFDDMMNQNAYNGTGSFSEYYSEVSDGDLSLSVDVFGWYEATNAYEYYGDENGDDRTRELIAEAIDAAEAAGVDFSNYDNDNNGTVDNLMVVHSGPGAEEGSQTQYIWSHSWSLGSSYRRTYDGVSIDPYIINPETRSYGMVGIGVFCHEFGHALGLPDLYDTNPDNGDSEGLGNWCLMAGGGWLNKERTPAYLSAWARDDLGWINPTVISADGDYALMPASTGTDCYRIEIPNSGEYFLLENRFKSGFDASLPGSGLAIYHINPYRWNNGDENNKLSDLEEADGLNQLDDDEGNNRGDAGDVFPGSSNNTTFNDSSNPNANSNDNEASGVFIRDIELSGTTVSFSLGKEIIPGIDLTYTPGSNSLSINLAEIDVDIQVKNDGTQVAGSFDVACYISEDAIITTSDYLVGTKSISSLNAGATVDLNLTQDIADVNPAIPYGNYYVGYIIDYQESVEELEEGNNSFVFSSEQLNFYVFPNLTYSSIENNFEINGSAVSIDLQIENIGNLASVSSKVGFYVSQNYPVSTSDYFIGEIQVGSLAVNESENKSFSVDVLDEIPTLPAGDYYVGYSVDSENAITELNEADNNYTYNAELIDNYFIPNLAFVSGQNNLAVNGSTVSVRSQVKNSGDLNSGDSKIAYYISKIYPIRSNAHFVGEVSVGDLDPNESHMKSFSVNVSDEIPLLPAGDYYVGMLVDYEDDVEEDNERDNSYTFTTPKVKLKSNLTFNADTNALDVTSTEINISFEVQNNGDALSEINRVGYYLSRDKTITTNDYFLDYNYIDVLSVGESSSGAISYDLTRLEGEVDLGNYYIGILVDYQNVVDEYDESDNDFVFTNSPFLYCPPVLTVLSETICEGDSVLFRDSVYKTEGVSEFVLSGQSGCDSVVILDLTVNPVDNIVLNEFICKGDSVSVNDIAYKASGVYVQNLTNKWGCDSTVTLYLEVGEPSEFVLTEAICSGDSFEMAGDFYHSQGTYTKTIVNRFGCDSTMILNLLVNQPSDTFLSSIICEGDSVEIGNSVFSETGIHTELLTNRFGCDSLITLDLIVNPVYKTEFEQVICFGDSVQIGSVNYFESGVYTNTYTNRFGCDSTIVLNLTVNPVNDTLLEVVLCEGESFQFGDSVYSETGIYFNYLLNKYNCDSIVTLDLMVNPASETLLEKTICKGDSFVVGTSIYKVTGSYIDVLQNSFGCDSIVYLQLMVNPVHKNDLHETICEGTSYTIAGVEYSSSGVYEHNFSNHFGCDSLVRLNLDVIPLPVIYLGDDFEMFSSETKLLDAGAGFENYQWTSGENTQTISINSFRGYGINVYSVVVSDEYLCTGSDDIEITIYDDSNLKEDKEPLLKVFPNPSEGNVKLLIEQISGEYELSVFDLHGSVVFTAEYISPGDKFVLPLNLSYLKTGTYSVQIVSTNKTLVERLIILAD